MAEVDYNQLGKDILTGVGGESNVSSVVHCATRMRFRLKDRDKAAREQIEKLPGVITVVENGGQFQVVIGNNVPRVYAGLPASLTADREGSDDSAPASGSVVGRIIDVVSSIFAPILGAMAATVLFLLGSAGFSVRLFDSAQVFLDEEMQRHGIQDRNLIKPGIGEATRVLLRRLPERLIVRNPEAACVQHLLTLAHEKHVRVEHRAQMPFQAVSIIRSALDA